MRSPGSWRPVVEHVLRGVGLAALLALAVRLWAGSSGSAVPVDVSSASLDSALLAWSLSPPARVTVNAATVPDRRQRDWLVALRRAGLPVDWTTTDTVGGALVVEAGPLPGSLPSITALGSPGTPVLLFDEAGRIDSARTGRDGALRWRVSPVGVTRSTLVTTGPSAVARDSLITKPVLVLGQAGWESRFVITALEEDGWTVVGRLVVAPGAVVRQGPAVRLDTASLSAVVVLDSISPLDAREVTRFVGDGGGVVASGAAANHPALRALLPASAARGSPGEVGALLGPAPREGLSARVFRASAGTVALERRGDAAVVMARRIGSGRALVTGYDETWRLRMTPPDENAPEAHRRWWSSIVASVAHSAPVSREVAPADEAPLAATIDALGDPVGADRPGEGAAPPWDALLAALAVASLVAEWLSRRLRGVA